MRLSDWSSDVCSSDLAAVAHLRVADAVGEVGQRGDLRPHRGVAGDGGMGRHGADDELAAVLADALQVPDAAEVDQVGRAGEALLQESGRASCRERVWQYV